jgi:hypothetical protein
MMIDECEMLYAFDLYKLPNILKETFFLLVSISFGNDMKLWAVTDKFNKIYAVVGHPT